MSYSGKMQKSHLYSVYFAPRGRDRIYDLGMQIAQLHLSPFDQIIGALDFNVLLMIGGTMGLVQLFIDSHMPERLADMSDTQPLLAIPLNGREGLDCSRDRNIEIPFTLMLVHGSGFLVLFCPRRPAS